MSAYVYRGKQPLHTHGGKRCRCGEPTKKAQKANRAAALSTSALYLALVSNA